MVKLTEEMIVARTRVSDMGNVKKLNCWGAELTDISVMRKLTNVEVLSLSVNCITTLADISCCKNLQELYIRKNKIVDLAEICWLKDLAKLKNLWLEENPCAQGNSELYRVTVIRNLPQLQKLDNVTVQADEMADAMRRGVELVHPFDQVGEPQYQMPPQMPPPAQVYQEQQQSTANGHSRRESRASYYDQQEYEEEQMGSRRQSLANTEQPQYYPPSRRVSNQVFDAPPVAHSPPESRRESQVRRGSSAEDGYIPDYPNRRYSEQGPVRRSPAPRSTSMDDQVRRMSLHHQPEVVYADDERNANYGQQRSQSYQGPTYGVSPSYGYQGGHYEYRQQSQQRRRDWQTVHENEELKPSSSQSGSSSGGSQPPSMDSKRQTNASTPNSRESPTNSETHEVSSDTRTMVAQYYDQTYQHVDHQIASAQQLIAQRKSSSLSPERPYPRRPKNRNSNILSAVLCLIKELDGPSLEVAEMAVRCRMEELED